MVAFLGCNPAMEEGPRGLEVQGKWPGGCAQTVNVVLEDGRTVGVQAQQYAVLVMDVPDLRGEAEKRALRSDIAVFAAVEWVQDLSAWKSDLVWHVRLMGRRLVWESPSSPSCTRFALSNLKSVKPWPKTPSTAATVSTSIVIRR